VNAVTWLGHSSTVIELDGTRFVTDPVLGRRVAHLWRSAAVPRAELGRLDVVLVSHVHLDHLDLSSLVQIGRAVPMVVPLRAGSILRRRGIEHVLEVVAGNELEFGPVRVHVTHAEHGVVRRYVRARTAAVGYVLRGSRSVYFAGDTDVFDGMGELGPVDVALLPVGGWGPRVPPGHLDAERAAQALRLIRPMTAVPVHWGTFRTPFASAPGEQVAHAFVQAAAAAAPQVDVRVLRIRETMCL
jgi:L-ascorbate metabolism protein UlaG (beta-lactamase superfamily)